MKVYRLSELFQEGCQKHVFDWRLEKVNVLMRNHNAERGQACHTMEPGAHRERKLVPNLRIINSTQNCYLILSWASILAETKIVGVRESRCVRVRAHHKQRRPFCKVASSLTQETFREVGYTHGRDVVGDWTRLSLKSLPIIKSCEDFTA